MRFQQLTGLARAMTPCEEYRDGGVRDLVAEIDRAKWYLWNGCPHRAITTLDWLTCDVMGYEPVERREKFAARVEETQSYLEKNRKFVVNYGERHRHGEPIATGFVESAVNQVVSRRFVKKQQMAWSAVNAHGVLQVRTTELNRELRRCFERWYPGLMAANDEDATLAA